MTPKIAENPRSQGPDPFTLLFSESLKKTKIQFYILEGLKPPWLPAQKKIQNNFKSLVNVIECKPTLTKFIWKVAN